MEIKNNILFVHFGDNWIRGSERCLIDLVSHLDKRKFNPVVWCNQSVLAQEMRKIDVPVFVDEFSVLFGWEDEKLNLKRYFFLKKRASELIKRWRINIVHSNSAAPNQWMVPVARKNQIPIVNHLHARYFFRDRFLLRIHQVNHSIGVSRPIIDQIAEDGIPESHLHVVPNGIDIQRLRSQPIINLRKSLGIDPNDFVIASIGSLIDRKGMHYIVEAMHLIEKDGVHKNVKLIVVGDGPERARLTKLVYDRNLNGQVFFIGENSNAFGILRGSADLFVSAAKEEVFGLVIAEAGLAGLASIAPNIGGIPGVLKENRTGILIPPEDPVFLKEAIITLIEQPNLRIQLGEEAKKHVEKSFSIKKNVEEMQNIYEMAVNEKGQKTSIFDAIGILFRHFNR